MNRNRPRACGSLISLYLGVVLFLVLGAPAYATFCAIQDPGGGLTATQTTVQLIIPPTTPHHDVFVSTAISGANAWRATCRSNALCEILHNGK